MQKHEKDVFDKDCQAYSIIYRPNKHEMEGKAYVERRSWKSGSLPWYTLGGSMVQ